MIAIPAVDLRGGCVQLAGGLYEGERVRPEDPLAVARSWARFGFQHLHVVDLDAATGRGSNAALVQELLFDRSLAIQVGGGVRSADAIERLLADGAAAVVIGRKAIEEPEWLSEVALAFPGELIVAADVRGRQVVTRGWGRGRTTGPHILDLIDDLNELPLRGVMVTPLHPERHWWGTDLPLMEDVAESSASHVYAGGGISAVSDLRSLADRGVAAAIVGMPLYTGVLDARAVAEEFFE